VSYGLESSVLFLVLSGKTYLDSGRFILAGSVLRLEINSVLELRISSLLAGMLLSRLSALAEAAGTMGPGLL